MKKEVQGRWGRVATRCAAIAERDEDLRREDDIIRVMHKDYDLSPDMREKRQRHTGGGRKSGSVASHSAAACKAFCVHWPIAFVAKCNSHAAGRASRSSSGYIAVVCI